MTLVIRHFANQNITNSYVKYQRILLYTEALIHGPFNTLNTTLTPLTNEFSISSEPRSRITIKGNARPLNAKSSGASTEPWDAFVRRYTRDLRTCVRIIRRTFTTRNSDEDLAEILVCEAAR